MPVSPLGREQALGPLGTMWRIRLFEERVGRLKQADEVHGLIHLSVGQLRADVSRPISSAIVRSRDAPVAIAWPRARRPE